MSKNLDQIFQQRRSRVTGRQLTGYLLFSLVLHAVLWTGMWFVPDLLASPQEEMEFVSVMVVPPALLGAENPPPPTPTPVQAPPPKPPPQEEPPKAAPEPEPIPADVPKLVEKKASPPPPRAKAVTPPPKAVPPPPKEPPKRQGSPFGNPIGSKNSRATVGVEDPDFTYGYYVDRVVALISENWVRPPVGSKAQQAIFYFRIQKDGTISELRLAETSGSEQFDESARRAVISSSPLPPLPKSYKREYLGINLIVR